MIFLPTQPGARQAALASAYDRVLGTSRSMRSSMRLGRATRA